jgi:hypothetical protein
MSEEKKSSSTEKPAEPAPKSRGFEIACAIVLSLATTASAWCAYQSKLWGGAQASRGGAAMAASREQAVNSVKALQARTFDASMFISYMDARFASNRPMEEFLFQRFRPEMKSAVDAWLKLDPLKSPDAPASPLQMKEYILKVETEAERLEKAAAAAATASREARRLSDNYVLLTVLFASVLFFGGIARAFDSRRLRLVLAVFAFALFVCNLAFLINMPLCHE